MIEFFMTTAECLEIMKKIIPSQKACIHKWESSKIQEGSIGYDILKEYQKKTSKPLKIVWHDIEKEDIHNSKGFWKIVSIEIPRVYGNNLYYGFIGCETKRGGTKNTDGNSLVRKFKYEANKIKSCTAYLSKKCMIEKKYGVFMSNGAFDLFNKGYHLLYALNHVEMFPENSIPFD